jgi:hypothetical protein
MIIKDGANIRGLNWRMRKAIKAADTIWRGFGRELVITSGLDGEHGPLSLHYFGCAVDLRSRYFRQGEARKAAEELQRVLGHDYDVVVEPTHIHVEYDPELARWP